MQASLGFLVSGHAQHGLHFGLASPSPAAFSVAGAGGAGVGSGVLSVDDDAPMASMWGQKNEDYFIIILCEKNQTKEYKSLINSICISHIGL